MNRKVLCSLLLGVLMFGVIFAQGQGSAKARKLLNEAAQQIKNSSGTEAQFMLAVENKVENMRDEYEGWILLKGDKYKLNILGVETYCDGETQWMHLLEEGEVNILPAEDAEEEGEFSPRTVFSMYEKGFALIYRGERSLDGEVFHEIDMFPKDRDESYFKVTVGISKKSGNFIFFCAHGKEGIDNIIQVKKLILNQQFAEELFVFDKQAHPDVEVIDLR